MVATTRKLKIPVGNKRYYYDGRAHGIEEGGRTQAAQSLWAGNTEEETVHESA